VYINSSSSIEVGEALILTCLATRVLNASGDVTIRWLGTDGNLISSSTSVSLGSLQQVSEAMSSLALQFSTLYTSHAGVYKCEATYTSETTTYTVSSDYELIVTGNLVFTTSYQIFVHELTICFSATCSYHCQCGSCWNGLYGDGVKADLQS